VEVRSAGLSDVSCGMEVEVEVDCACALVSASGCVCDAL
jgi:hypothetical protein